jgi:hypothetical protein
MAESNLPAQRYQAGLNAQTLSGKIMDKRATTRRIDIVRINLDYSEKIIENQEVRTYVIQTYGQEAVTQYETTQNQLNETFERYQRDQREIKMLQ